MRLFVFLSFLGVVVCDPYVPGTPGGEWSPEEVLIVKAKLYRIYSRWGGIAALRELYPDHEGPFTGGWTRLPNAAKALRLGFHDCLKYTDGTGGCDGCLNWTGVFYKQPDLTNTYSGPDAHATDNNGLGYMVEVLEGVYTDPAFPSMTPALPESLRDSGKSRADLWALAAITAAEYGIETNNRQCDDPGNMYASKQCHHEQGEPGCKIELKSHFQFQTGRSDCVTDQDRPYKAAKEESHPNPVGSGYDTAEFFEKDFGLTGREMVALLGAHTFGRFHYGVSLFRYVWTSRGTELFNNHYYKNIVRKPEILYDDDVCTKNTDAWGNTPPTRWVAHVRGDTENGGPVHWIHENHACPNCVAKPDDPCCQGVDTSVNYCLPDAPAYGTDPDTNGGCERYRFIVGIDEMALSSEIGLYFDFNVTNGIPNGCPGFQDFTTEKFKQGYGYTWTRVDNRKADPDCGFQNLQIPAGSTPTSQVFEEYADDQDRWIKDFGMALEKMLANGYKPGCDLKNAPDQWTDVTCPPQNPWDGARFYNCYKTGDSYFKIVNAWNGQVIQQDLNDGNYRAVMWEDNGSDLQLWTWSSVGDQLINKQTNMPLAAGPGRTWRVDGESIVDTRTGRVMDRGWNANNGAGVGTWDSHGAANQKFSIVNV